MIGELLLSSYTLDQGRVALNNAFSATSSFNAATFNEAYSTSLSGGTLYSGNTDLYNVFQAQGSDIWISGSSGNYSVKENNDSGTDATGNYATASGFNTSGTGYSSFACNNSTLASGNTSFAAGYNTVAGGDYSFAQGQLTLANGYSSHAEGVETITSGSASHSEGSGTTAIGDASHAEGGYNISFGLASHAEGGYNIASGAVSHAEGGLTTTVGNNSHSEGGQTTANGATSHTEGKNTVSYGQYSHAEGNHTIASGEASHAEGYYTMTSGEASHAEGYYTTAGGYSQLIQPGYSHAEGCYTTAYGQYSHAEGYYTIASGEASHAEGAYTTALGKNSNTFGNHTTAKGSYSLTHGSLNANDASCGVILGGSNNYLDSTANYSAIIGGFSLTGTQAYTTYVYRLNVNKLDTGTLVAGLGIDINGNVVSGTSAFQTLIDDATITWGYDLGANAFAQLGGNRSLSITGVSDGDSGTLIVQQDGSGSRTLSFSGTPGTHKIVNGGGGSVLLSSGINAEDIISFVYRASTTTFYWNIGYNYN